MFSTQCLFLYPGPRSFLLILSFLIWKFEMRNADRSAKRKESLWSRSLTISLSCRWLYSTWQLSKMSFSFDQSHPQRYLIHPIIWLVEQLKISSNQKWRSKADGMQVRIPGQQSWPDAFFSRLSALCAHKNEIKEEVCQICQERIKEASWTRVSFLSGKFWSIVVTWSNQAPKSSWFTDNHFMGVQPLIKTLTDRHPKKHVPCGMDVYSWTNNLFTQKTLLGNYMCTYGWLPYIHVRAYGLFTQMKGSARNVCTFFNVHWHF